jgi:benzoyl-CoA reductase/2-hydroxyglutaryl-CoA dehydratase subunit BcrC/BadD/HgdB
MQGWLENKASLTYACVPPLNTSLEHDNSKCYASTLRTCQMASRADVQQLTRNIEEQGLHGVFKRLRRTGHPLH